ncbi:hypothetical protein CHR53_16290 [Neobacillus mesonae]|uniref:F5/8 type C domain-containing protein n=1 Tax=Neobacillus mesonae TaxID=1193713 RepID=A0A3T0I0I6_9BACI|nr:hypothetical protein CHR53_16290 [Neobacillus mesonae]
MTINFYNFLLDKFKGYTTLLFEQIDFKEGSYLHDVTITLAATDAGIGVSHIEYSLDNGATWKRYEEGLTVSKEGKNSIQYRAIDKVHNVSETKTIEVFITSATIENAISLVKQAKGNNGIKTSLSAQLEDVIKTFEKGQKNKAYQSLEKIYSHTNKFTNKDLEEVDKKEIMFMLQYILEHQSANSGDESPALLAS